MSASGAADRLSLSLDPGGTKQTIRRLGALDVLVLAAWCGLAAGWLEVATRVLLKSALVTDRMYNTTRHFIWVVPLSNLVLFVSAGLLLAAATKLWPRPAAWISPRIICAAALVPALMVAIPRVYPWAWLLLAAGLAMRIAPRLERTLWRWRRWAVLSLPALSGLVLVVAGFVFGGDRLKLMREARRSLPNAACPNVLLIVLDTVRADRLSLYGYPRATTPVLKKLSESGIRFDEARATAPWTLPSHASMFTGYLPHELDVRWRTAFGAGAPTLAEYLGSRGYATAGFVANTQYCSYDAGLDRGFTQFEDYPIDLKHLRPLRSATLFDRAWEGLSRLGMLLDRGRYNPLLHWILAPDRKDAGAINHEFTNWLSHRQDARRPFFAFLNYYDTHAPYLPPEGTRFRFGPGPRSVTDFMVLVERWKEIDKIRLGQYFVDLIEDSYENCLAYLDWRLGELFDELKRRDLLEKTLVIITADHGEELGDHALFEHGESLYRAEIQVPLLVLLPSGKHSGTVVRDTVSLRDLPATIVDLAGVADGARFPGRSLARLWNDERGTAAGRDAEGAFSELREPNPTNPSRGRSPAVSGPLVSVALDDYVYIRNERNGEELLFHEREDPLEFFNRAKDEMAQPILKRLRQRLDEIKAGPARSAPQAARSGNRLAR
jgi:arylsulfatase A-like enzyme